VTRAAILAAVLLVARPDLAVAGSTCGTSGGGGSSGDSSSSDSSSSDSSSSSSDSSSSSSTSSTPACHDTTDVVGYRECTRFGTWAQNLKVPRMIVQLVTTMRATPSLAGDRSGTFAHGAESFAYRTVAAPEAGRDHQVVTGVRIGVGLPHGMFVAVEGEGGSIVAPAGARPEMTSSGTFGTPTISQGTGIAFNAAAVAGVQRRLGLGRVGVELAGGVRTAHYSFQSSYHLCETATNVSAAAPLVEARVSYERWLSPFISAGATVGASVVDRGSWMGGLQLGFHTRAFGGSR